MSNRSTSTVTHLNELTEKRVLSPGWWALLGLIFVVGLALRLYHLDDPPVDFHPTRQLHSAIIARGMFLANDPGADAQLRGLAEQQWGAEGVIEPQVMEHLAAWGYAVVGQADLRIPRLLAIFFWMVAAVFVVWLALDLSGPAGALGAALFFLAWPYGVIASRAFQPEPLLLAAMSAALWAALRWQARPHSWRWALTAGILAGFAIYIKVVAVFFLGPALAVLALLSTGPRRVWRNPRVWMLASLALIPYALYHIDGVYLRGFLVGQFSLRFFPQMWLDPAFYLRWVSNLGRALPFEMLLLALFGAFLARDARSRGVLLAMWVGYLVYGLALSHHISTHDYYHLPLFLPAALGLGIISAALYAALRASTRRAGLLAALFLIALLTFSAYTARTQIKRSDALAQAAVWQAVGRALPPGASAAALVDDYGAGLEYYAWIMPTIWPTAADQRFQQSAGQPYDGAAEFARIAAQKDFFIAALPGELANQPALTHLLVDRYPILAQGPGYILYDLRAGRP